MYARWPRNFIDIECWTSAACVATPLVTDSDSSGKYTQEHVAPCCRRRAPDQHVEDEELHDDGGLQRRVPVVECCRQIHPKMQLMSQVVPLGRAGDGNGMGKRVGKENCRADLGDHAWVGLVFIVAGYQQR